MEYRVQIEALPRRVNSGKGNSEQKYRVLYNSEELCVARTPICEAARKLLELGLAQRNDVILMCRGDRVDMRVGVGWAADRTVNESRGDGTPRYAKWSPFWSRDAKKSSDDDNDEA